MHGSSEIDITTLWRCIITETWKQRGPWNIHPSLVCRRYPWWACTATLGRGCAKCYWLFSSLCFLAWYPKSTMLNL